MNSTSKIKLFPFALLLTVMFFLAGFLVVTGMNTAKMVFPGPDFSQSLSVMNTDNTTIFTADGEAKLAVIPDQVTIHLGITAANAASVKTAQDTVNEVIENFKQQVTALGIENNKLKTTNYSLYPNYDWSGEVQRISGYNANSTLEVTFTDFALLNQVVDLATNVGINEISSINFTLSDAKMDELEKQAREDAIAQAKQNAQNLAQLTGVTLGKIINVTESQYSPAAESRMYSMELADQAAGAPTNLEAGETTFNYQVTLYYQTY